MARWLAVLAVAASLIGVADRGAGQSCVGDCNGDGRVTVDELIRAVSSARCLVCLDPPSTPCPGFENTTSINAFIAALVGAVNNALYGCPEDGTAGIAATSDMLRKGGPRDGEVIHIGPVACE